MRRGRAALVALAVTLGSTAASAQRLLNHDWLVLQPEVGVSYANVVAINNSGLFPSATSTGGTGLHYGVGAGMRFGPFTGGVRVDYSHYTPYDLGGAGLFVELRIPTPFIQPFGRVSGGYAWLGNLNADPSYLACGSTGASSSSCPSVSGWYASVGGGVDLALFRHFTLGANLDVNVLNLTRGASPTSVMFTNPGDSIGLQLTLGVHAALRF